MKKLLLTCGVLTMAASAAFATSPGNITNAKSLDLAPTIMQKVERLNITETKKLSKNLMLQKCTDANGLMHKRVAKNNGIALNHRAKTASRSEDDFYENFEAYDGSANWIPEGWVNESVATENVNRWFTMDPSAFIAEGNEGDYACMIGLSEEYCDEWLITPAIEVKEGQQLSFLCMYDLLFLIDWAYLDLDTYEISEYHPSATLKIWASEEGGDWVLLRDLYDDAVGLTFDELFDAYDGNFKKVTVDLDGFGGKTVRIAFEYIGTDGNTMGIDAVSVTMPEVKCYYDYPWYVPFFGITPKLMGMSLSIPIVPVYTPITWEAETNVPEAECTWLYLDAESEYDFAFGNELTATYHSDYSSDFTTRNNLYYSPELYASAPGYSTGSYTKYDYFQAGGRADWENGGEVLSFGMAAHDPAKEGYTHLVDENKRAYFGYDETRDEYWTNFHHGVNHGENTSSLTAILNAYVTPDAPLVFERCWAHAFVQGLHEDAVFKLEVMPCEDNGMPGEPIATATCTAQEAFVGLPMSTGDYYTLMFEFDEPVVVTKDLGDLYVIKLSGFHGAADFFAPMQSYWEAANELDHGYAWFEGVCNGEDWVEVTPLLHFTGVDQSFGIIIDGAFPWLQAVEAVSIAADEAYEIALDSFYDGADLTYEAPEWLDVAISGRYGECKATITSHATTAQQGKLVITGAGVSATIEVSTGASAITDINTVDFSKVNAVYNLQVVKVDANNLPAGVYIMQKCDGTSSKVQVR